jgi:hypothetical protein
MMRLLRRNRLRLPRDLRDKSGIEFTARPIGVLPVKGQPAPPMEPRDGEVSVALLDGRVVSYAYALWLERQS